MVRITLSLYIELHFHLHIIILDYHTCLMYITFIVFSITYGELSKCRTHTITFINYFLYACSYPKEHAVDAEELSYFSSVANFENAWWIVDLEQQSLVHTVEVQPGHNAPAMFHDIEVC